MIKIDIGDKNLEKNTGGVENIKMKRNDYYVVEFIKGDLKGKRYSINVKEEDDKLYLIGPFENC